MKTLMLITGIVSFYWYNIGFQSKEYRTIQRPIPVEDTFVYAGRYDLAVGKYSILGLPRDREWLTAKEWRGDHLVDTTNTIRKNFSIWKDNYRKNFIKNWVAYAQEESRVSGVPASLIIAQAILESNWGKSRLAVQANNYFGHKFRGDDKKYIIAADDSPNDKFTVYKSIWWNIRYHTKILNGIYKKRLKGNNLNHWLEALCGGLNVQDSKEFVDNGGMVYATSCYNGEECYSNKLKKIINCYKLYKYDINANKKTLGKSK